MGTVVDFKSAAETSKIPPPAEDECKVLTAMLEDSLGGVDKARLEQAIETCECDECS